MVTGGTSLRLPITLTCGALVLLSACNRHSGNAAPPKVTTAADFPSQTSTIVVPVSGDLATIGAALDRELPPTLWRIDQHQDKCVPAQRVNLGIAKIKVLPQLGCRIVGRVTRGAITLGGSGNTLLITMPVRAEISARDVGGIIKNQTGTGTAMVHARAKLGIAGNWVPTAKVDIDYDWTEAPGIDFLGQRIEFVKKADERLTPIVAKLERTLPQELAKMRLRDRLASAWAQGFTTLQLNRDNPPAWMRVTPRQLGVGGYRIIGRRLELTLAADAVTETFVGNRPADPTPTPLPPPARRIGAHGLNFFIPVLADYAQLEPIVKRALVKLAAKGITLTGVGPVDAKFGRVTIYATQNAHLAVGVQASVKAKNHSLASTKGTIWLTAIPYNQENSQVVRARDIAIAGETDSAIANLLFALFSDTGVQDSIREGLTHDFARDYQKVLVAAQKAIGARQERDFLLSAKVTSVRNGAIRVTGQGLFLPVQATGEASIAYRPRKDGQ